MDERPRYGYGSGGRPLWSPRDRDAEAVRRALLRGGLRDFGERRLDGFVVEGANASEDGDEPLSVAYCGSVDLSVTMDRYRRVLERARLLVEADPQDEQILLVARRSVTSVGRAP